MNKLVYCCLTFFVASCGPGWSEYSEEIAEGYTFINEGEGFNGISSNHRSIPHLGHLKKYGINDNYICAWQADSAMFAAPDFRMTQYKKNTYYKSDRFYIIDIQKEKLYGPFRKNEFFMKAKS